MFFTHSQKLPSMFSPRGEDVRAAVAARGDWGSFIPGDADSGMNQNLKLLKEAVVVVP